MRNIKVFIGALVITLAFASLLTATKPADAAAVKCYGNYCSGRDPQTTGCAADGVTVAYKDVPGGRLELRWSNRCKSNWTRWQQYSPRISSPVPMEIRAVQDTGYTQRKKVAADDGSVKVGTYWTPMIYSPKHRVRAEAPMTCSGIGSCVISTFTGNPVRTGWR